MFFLGAGRYPKYPLYLARYKKGDAHRTIRKALVSEVFPLPPRTTAELDLGGYPCRRLNDAPSLTSQAIDVCTQEGTQGIAISPRARRHGKRVRRALSFFLSVNQPTLGAFDVRHLFVPRDPREREKEEKKNKKRGRG